MDPTAIRTSKVFRELFEIDLGVQSAIQADMEINGFDESQPLIMGKGKWTKRAVLIDGHMRMGAAIAAELKDVPVVVKPFKTEQDAIAYAVHLQKDRRNISEAMLIDLAERFQLTAGQPGRKKALEGIEGEAAPYGRPIEKLATDLNVSRDKAKKIKAVVLQATKTEKQLIKSGKLTVSGAYNRVMERQREQDIREKRWNARIQTLCKHLITSLSNDEFVLDDPTKAALAQVQAEIQKPAPTKPEPEQTQEADILDKI